MMEAEEGTRRTTRAALAEIPFHLGRLRVSPPRAETAPLTAINMNTPTAVDGAATNGTPRNAFTTVIHGHLDNTPNGNGIPSAMLSPTPSPDELVIQQRGRRRMPVTWSPDIDYRKQSPFQSNIRTPPKVTPGSSRSSVVLRSTPRKRLLMTDLEKTNGTPEKVDFNDTTTPQKLRNSSPTKSPTPKRVKVEKKISFDNKVSVDALLKGMTHEQLIDIIKSTIMRHPELEKELRNDLPVPDIRSFEDKLTYLKRNIFRSLPSSRLTSKTDSPAYTRAATHVIAFKKYLLDKGKTLIECQHWPSVLEYAIAAWNCVKSTPLWDNYAHNLTRRQCFKFLVSMCATALKKGDFDPETLQTIRLKLQLMVTESDDIKLCLKVLESQLNNADTLLS